MIHITGAQSDDILDVITHKNTIDNEHLKSLESTMETFNFTTFGDKSFSEHLSKRNRLIIPAEDQGYIEFIIHEAIKYRDAEGLKMDVYSKASYLEDLKKGAIIEPQTLDNQTVSTAVAHALNGTNHRAGIIEGTGTRTFEIENDTNPYAFLKQIATEFELELSFRVETDGNRVTGRYVDLLEQTGEWRGREVTFGKDLQSIRRIEKTDNVYTALKGIGPELEDGTRLEVLVEDEEALQRWGRPNEFGELQHLVDVYEPQSSRSDMTLSELRQYTRTELNKRINEVVEYEGNVVDLEHVPGMQNKKIRFGDTIKIKDTEFNPPLYLEARIFEQARNIFVQSRKRVKLGDYTEYTEEEVQAIWKSLQDQIRDKISNAELIEYTYDKITIDDKDEYVFDEGKTFAEVVGEDAKGYADVAAWDAESNANDYAEQVAEDRADQALIDAQNYAVAQTVYDNQMQSIADDIADRAPIEYVDGQFTTIDDRLDDFDAELEQKADGSTVYTISEVDNMINNTVSITQYTEDINGIISDLDTQGTQIGQNVEAIGLKADSSRVDTVEGIVDDHSAEFLVMADEISSKVDSTYVDEAVGDLSDDLNDIIDDIENGIGDLDTNLSDLEDLLDGVDATVSQHSTDISQNATAITQRALQTELDAESGRITDAFGEISTLAGEVNLRASQTDLDTIAGRVTDAEGEIRVMSNEIEAKVDVDGVIAAINLSTDTIDGGQIDLIGAVTVLSDITGDLGSITAGDITGVNITGSTITQDDTDRTILLDNEGIDVFSKIDSTGVAIMGSVPWGEDIPETTGSFLGFYHFEGSERVWRNIIEENMSGTLNFRTAGVVVDQRNNLPGEPALHVEGNANISNYLTSYRARTTRNGTSGGVWIADGINNLNNDTAHIITAHSPDGTMTLYPQRYSGQNVLDVRSHHQRGSYRNEFSLLNDGRIYTQPTRDNVVTWSNRVSLGGSTAVMGFVSSSERYKVAIEEVDVDPYKILDLQPKSWYDKGNTEKYADLLTRRENGEDVSFNEIERIERIPGLIAEDVHNAGLCLYVDYGEDGRVEGIDDDRLWTLLIPITRDHNDKIADLENRVEQLEKGVA